MYLLIKNVVENYTLGDKASLATLAKCRIQGAEHTFNFEKLKPSGYSNIIFQADAYDVKVRDET